MPFVDQTYFKSPTESIDQYNARVKGVTSGKNLASYKTPALSPTVISDATFREDTKPQLNNRLNTLTGNKPTYTGQDGNLYYADGSGAAAAPVGASPDGENGWEYNGQSYLGAPQYAEDSQENALIAGMIQNTDAQTRQILQGIQQQYATRKIQQADINKRAEAATEQALLMSGSSRYAPISSGQIQQAQESYGLQQIADLDTQEQTLIAQAKAAQQSQNYKIMSEALTAAENIRQEKQKAATKLSDALVAQNQKAREQMKQASRDSAISGLLAQGVTDPTQMLDYLNYDEQGNLIGDFSAKEINEALKNLNPQQSAVMDILKTASANGAPPDILSKIGASRDLDSAYKAAGSYAAGGTGIIGEYNRYIADEEKNGRIPMDFSSYQTEDANRKRQIVNLNSGGLTSQENSSFLGITNKYQADSIVNAAIKAGQIQAMADQIIKNPNNTSNQLMSLYLFVKNLDPDSAVREGELALANQTQSYQQQYGNYLARVSKGQVLDPAAAKELAEATKRLVSSWQDTAQKKTKLYRAQAKNSSPNVGNAFDSYIMDSMLFPTTGEVLGEKSAASLGDSRGGIQDYLTSNPQDKDKVKALLEKLGNSEDAWAVIQTW